MVTDGVSQHLDLPAASVRVNQDLQGQSILRVGMPIRDCTCLLISVQGRFIQDTNLDDTACAGGSHLHPPIWLIIPGSSMWASCRLSMYVLTQVRIS